MALITGSNRYEWGDIITLASGTATAAEVKCVVGGAEFNHVIVSVRTAAAWGGTATITPYMDADDTVGGEPQTIAIAQCTSYKGDLQIDGCYSIGVSVASNDKATTVRVSAWRD